MRAPSLRRTASLCVLGALAGCSSSSKPDAAPAIRALTLQQTVHASLVGAARVVRGPTGVVLAVEQSLVAQSLAYRATADALELRLDAGSTITLRPRAVGRRGARGRAAAPWLVHELVVDGATTIQRGPDVDAWLRGGALGLELGVDLARPPRGRDTAPLTFDWEIAGGRLEASNGRATLRDAQGGFALAVHSPSAWDSRGRSLPCRLEGDSATLRIVVDDRDAVYPLHVDPIFDTATRLALAAPAGGESAGTSVAAGPGLAAIGAPGDASATGSVTPFADVAKTWTAEPKLTPPAPAAGLRFGASVAIDGNLMVVGAPGSANGAAYVFRRKALWEYVSTLVASDGAAGDSFGAAVAVANGHVVVGAPGNDALAGNAGTAYVFAETPSGFILQGKLVPSLYAPGDAFGSSVATDGTSYLVGAPWHASAAGAAFAFRDDGSGLLAVPLPSPSTVLAGDNFGKAVAVSGSSAFVGAPKSNVGASGGGAVYAFAFGTGAWTSRARLRPDDFSLQKAFGSAVAVRGAFVVIGAPGDVVATTSVGSAYVLVDTGTALSPITKLFAPTPAAWAGFGAAVALASEAVIVGAPGDGTSGAGYALLPSRAGTNGVACASSLECKSGVCTDGVCCDVACDGRCAACVRAKTGVADGSCAPALAGTDPDVECSRDPDFTCGQTGACDGAGACELYPAGTRCGPSQCADAVVSSQRCDGRGGCAPSVQACAPFACDPFGGVCQGECHLDADCARDAYCALGLCTYRKPNGAKAAVAHECASAFLADGVCCNVACDGACEACDVTGALGTCLPVPAGDPARHGACPAGEVGKPCSAHVCDGKTRATCEGFVGNEVVCAAPACASGQESWEARCTGAGTCATAKAQRCDGYACDGASCRTRCEFVEDCDDGYDCNYAAARCEKRATCAPGDQSVVAPSGLTSDCSPYRCVDGACLKGCNSTDDCLGGNSCDPTTHTCTLGSGASADTGAGGCASGPTRDGSSPPFAWLMGAVGAALLVARRRIKSGGRS